MVIETVVLLNICFESRKTTIYYYAAFYDGNHTTCSHLTIKTSFKQNWCPPVKHDILALTLKCTDTFVVGNDHFLHNWSSVMLMFCCERMRSSATIFARNTQAGRANLHSADLIGRSNPRDRICRWVTGVLTNQHSDSTATEACWREKTHNRAEIDTRCSALSISQHF